ncbi:MAG: hypothetical protein KDA80_22490, partial [Planctomycetaceae bacterium]|nr:hypothetical protein [Planctomycetaceae bacterium]
GMKPELPLPPVEPVRTAEVPETPSEVPSPNPKLVAIPQETPMRTEVPLESGAPAMKASPDDPEAPAVSETEQAIPQKSDSNPPEIAPQPTTEPNPVPQKNTTGNRSTPVIRPQRAAPRRPLMPILRRLSLEEDLEEESEPQAMPILTRPAPPATSEDRPFTDDDFLSN